MSFGFGSGGGFGSNTNTSGGGFGGFGSNNNTGSAFGSGGGGFGSNNNNTPSGGGGLFGNTSSGGGAFGTGGGFGAANNTGGGFGSKPAFGSTSAGGGGGLFGSAGTSNTPSTGTGFGGFGSNTTTTPSTGGSAFGGGTGGSLFGSNKPSTGFGAANTAGTGSSLFGGGAATGGATSGGFGSTSSGGGFGATSNPGIGAVGDPPGTNAVPFNPTVEKELNSTGSNSFQNVLFQEPYKKWSADELRLADYNQGRRFGNASGSGAFGVSSGFGSGGFGANTNTTSSGFGGGNTGGGLFGGNNTASTGGAFGSTNNNTTGGFGSNTGGGGLFGQNKPATGGNLFGGGATSQPAQSGGLFGSGGGGGGFGSNTTTNNTGGAFGSTNTANTGGGLFGSANNNQPKPGGFSFGGGNNTNQTASNPFGGGGAATGGFGSNNNTNTGATGGGGGLFGNTQQNTGGGGGLFGGGAQNTQPSGGGLFGNNNNQQQQQQQQPAAGGLFGNNNANNQPKPGGLFGGGATGSTGGGLFGNQQQSNTTSTFGANNNQQAGGGGLFGQKPAATGGGLFGNANQGQTGAQGGTGGGLFGGLGQNNQNQQQPGTGGGLFGNNMNNNQQSQQQQPKPSLFGGTAATGGGGGGLFGGQNNQPSGGGMFGGIGQQQPQQNQGSMLGGSLFGGAQQQPQTQSLSTSVNDPSAYGTSLFQNLGSGEVQNPGPLATPLSSNKGKQRKSSILPMYRLNPGVSSKFTTPQKRGYGLTYSTMGTSPGAPTIGTGAPGGGLGQSLLGASTMGRSGTKTISSGTLRRNLNVDESILTPGAFSNNSGSRTFGGAGNVKRLVINRDLRSDLFSTPQLDKDHDDGTGSRKLAKRVSFDTRPDGQSENGTTAESPHSDAPYIRPSNSSSSSTLNGGSPGDGFPHMEQVRGDELAIVPEEEEEAESPTPKPHSAVNDGLGEYWMQPSREEILAMNRVQRQKVTDFTIGRDNVGSIRFKTPVDLSSIDMDELIGTIVILEPRSATVYPDTAKKPPIGKGLNVPSEITLEHSWPRAGKRMQDKTGQRLAKHIERLKRIDDTTFVNYDDETGTWTFDVEHFTTYGLDDDDETTEYETEPEETTAAVPTTNPASQPLPQIVGSPDLDPVDDTLDFQNDAPALPGAFNPKSYRQETQLEKVNPEQPFLSERSAGSKFGAVMPTEAHDEAMDEGYAQSEGEGEEDPALEQHHAAELDVVPHPSYDDAAMPETHETPGGIMRARLRARREAELPVSLEITEGDDWVYELRQSVSRPRRADRDLLRAINDKDSYKSAADQEQRIGPRADRMLRDELHDGQGFATSLDLMNSLFGKANGNVSRSTEGLASRPMGPVQWLSASKHGHPYASFACKLNNASTSWDKAANVPRVEIGDQSDLSSLQPELSICDKQVWELASILFDGDGATRRKALAKYWKSVVSEASSELTMCLPGDDAKAVACLAGNQTIEACRYLESSKNYKLGALVAVISGNDQSRVMLHEQVASWERNNILSEIPIAVRALYSILSGDVGTCRGKNEGGIENRVEAFTISKQFSLNWKQAFGLRLWYTLSAGEDVAVAIRKYKHDVDAGVEEAPTDLAWDLLKLYAGEATLEETLQIEKGLPLCWLLGQALVRSGKAHFMDRQDEKLDALTLAYADLVRHNDVQVPNLQAWGQVAWVLLHLASPVARARALQDHVSRHGGLLFADMIRDFVRVSSHEAGSRSNSTSSSSLRTQRNELWKALNLPARWGFESLALYARNQDESHASLEAYALLRAELYTEAHEVIINKIVPVVLIQNTAAAKKRLAYFLDQFEGKEDLVLSGWDQGGGLYRRWLRMDGKSGKGEGVEMMEEDDEKVVIVDREAVISQYARL